MKITQGVPNDQKQTALLITAPKVRPLTRGLKTARLLVRMQQRIYPEQMREDAKTILSILRSTDMSRGLFSDGKFIGYALFQRADEERTIYLYDIAVLPHLQHKGLGTKLAQEALRATRSKGLSVKMHVRATSYPLFSNPRTLRMAGYRLVKDKFLRDWYFGEFGIHEDAHELLMEPLGKKQAVTARSG